MVTGLTGINGATALKTLWIGKCSSDFVRGTVPLQSQAVSKSAIPMIMQAAARKKSVLVRRDKKIGQYGQI